MSYAAFELISAQKDDDARARPVAVELGRTTRCPAVLAPLSKSATSGAPSPGTQLSRAKHVGDEDVASSLLFAHFRRARRRTCTPR